MSRRETLEGYLVEVDSFRSEPGDPLTRARAHGRDRLLAGLGRDATYGLVIDDGRLKLLDAAARSHIEGAVHANPHTRGIRVRVERAERGGSMHTTAIHSTEGWPSQMTGGKEGSGWSPWKGMEE